MLGVGRIRWVVVLLSVAALVVGCSNEFAGGKRGDSGIMVTMAPGAPRQPLFEKYKERDGVLEIGGRAPETDGGPERLAMRFDGEFEADALAALIRELAEDPTVACVDLLTIQDGGSYDPPPDDRHLCFGPTPAPPP